MKNKIRNLAIALLDDGHGINEEAFNALMPVLEASENNDILLAIECVEGRYFISEDAAATLKG